MSTSDNVYARNARGLTEGRPSRNSIGTQRAHVRQATPADRGAMMPDVARDRRAVRAYALIGAFCALFSFIYAQFSHGVYSPFMTYMCLIPLVGGAGVLALIRALGLAPMRRVAFNAYNSGIATLTIGSVLCGIFEIAGTASVYTPVFLVVGIGFIVGAAIMSIYAKSRN